MERDKTEVDKGRIKVAELAGEVVGLQREIAENTVRVLEGVKFGSVARGVVAEAGFLAKLAEGMGEKLRCPPLPPSWFFLNPTKMEGDLKN